MIPFDYITEWRAEAPWTSEAQVEQDLILSRAVVAMFAEPEVANPSRRVLCALPRARRQAGQPHRV